MSQTPFRVDQFGGLDLVTDASEGGPSRCLDMLNMERPLGRLKTRDGYDNFTSSAAGARLRYVAPYYTTTGTKQLVVTTASAASSNALIAYTTAGAVVAHADPGGTGNQYGRPAMFGNPSSEVMYCPFFLSGFGGVAGGFKWNGTSFTGTIGTDVTSVFDMVANWADQSRMVGARQTAGGPSISKVGFSGAGDAEAYTGTDFVEITPGDGEMITALVSWRELLFCFKESKFATFYSVSTDTTGGAIFNYRMVDSGVGCVGSLTSSGPACAGRPGVFFLNRRGVYMTTGGEPTLISRALDPLFTGDLPDVYAGSAINQAQLANLADMCWMNERLYVSVPTGSSTFNDRLLVWDSQQDSWLVWDIASGGLCAFRQGNATELHFSYATGSNHVGRQSSSFTTDDGSAISWRWRSGWFDLSGADSEAFTRWSRIRGTGSPTLSVFTDYATSDANAGAVTLGTAPTSAEAYHLKSYGGKVWSHKFSGTAAAAVDSLTHDVAFVRPA